MPKQLVNNRILKTNSMGRVLQHDLWVSQDLTEIGNPTFANLQLTGDATIEGNLYVLGNTSVFDTNIVEFEDNIVLLNSREAGNGVSFNQAGLEVYRGPSAIPFRLLYQEQDRSLRFGFGTDLKEIVPVASSPIPNGVATWNEADRELTITDTIQTNLHITTTENSTSISTGSLVIDGGLSVQKNIRTNGEIMLSKSKLQDTDGTLTVTSSNGVEFSSTYVRVPALMPFRLGDSANILIDSQTNLAINATGFVDFNASSGVRVPGGVPIILSKSQTETKIYSGSVGEMTLESFGEIVMKPTSNVRIPVNIPLVFNSSGQRVFANASNDLNILAGNNIILSPGFNVRLPNNKGAQFGDTGSQRIYSNNTNVLYVTSANDIELNPATSRFVKLPSNAGLSFGGESQNIKEANNQNLMLSAGQFIQMLSNVTVDTTEDAVSATTGSIKVSGGIGVSKRVFSETGMTIRSNSSSALLMSTLSNNVVTVDLSSSNGHTTVSGGDGSASEPCLTLTTRDNVRAFSLVELKSSFDDTSSYNIGRGTTAENGGRVLSFCLPNYSDYASQGQVPKFVFYSGEGTKSLFEIQGESGNSKIHGELHVESAAASVNATTGSLVLKGGLATGAQSFFAETVTISNEKTIGFHVKNAGDSGNIVEIDTMNRTSTLKGDKIIFTPDSSIYVRNSQDTDLLNYQIKSNQLSVSSGTLFTNTTESSNASHGSLVVSGGMALQKNMRVYGVVSHYNTVDLNQNVITNLPTPSADEHAANKGYVDLLTMGSLNLKQSATVSALDNIVLDSNALQPNTTLDGYVLQEGDRVLLVYQTSGIENGIYIVPSVGNVPVRASDFGVGDSAHRAFVFVDEGDRAGFISWVCVNEQGSSTIGTDNLQFVKFYGNSKLSAGDGLTKNGSSVDVNVDEFSIEIVDDTLRIHNAGIGTGLLGGSGVSLTTNSDQSHVTRLGTIEQGAWNASTVDVQYGGTGQTEFTAGSILYGNGTQSLSTSNKFVWDPTNDRLGVGTHTPSSSLHIETSTDADIRVSAGNGAPSVSLKKGTSSPRSALLKLVSTDNETANGSYEHAVLLTNENTDTASRIQLATRNDVRMTIASNGNVGINQLDPQYTLDVDGQGLFTGRVTVTEAIDSTGRTTGSFVVEGGAAIHKSLSLSGNLQVFSDGATTKGVVFYSDSDTIEGHMLSSSGNIDIFAGKTLTLSSDNVSIQSTEQCVSITTGGLVVSGGVGVQKNVMVGGDFHVFGTSSSLGDLKFGTGNIVNRIESGNTTFKPILVGNGSNTITTLHETGVIIENNSHLQIGGELGVPGGADISYSGGTLSVQPIEAQQFEFGNVTKSADIIFNGTQGSNMTWNSKTNTLRLDSSSMTLEGVSATLRIVHPDINNDAHIVADGGNSTLFVGGGGDQELKTVLSNSNKTESVTFEPQSTHGTLTVSTNVVTNLEGPVRFNNNDVIFKGNRTARYYENSSMSASWLYIGRINTSLNSSDGTESGYIDIKIHGGNTTTSTFTRSLELKAITRNGELSASHYQLGNTERQSAEDSEMYIFNDGSDNYHLFVLSQPSSRAMISIEMSTSDSLRFTSEGTNAQPSGATSGYQNGWTNVYTTTSDSNMKLELGAVDIEGHIQTADNFPVIGYNNDNVNKSRDLGLMFQRYQKDNDNGEGDVVQDSAFQTGQLPSQAGVVEPNQVILDNSTGFNFRGWWLMMTSGDNSNQVRRIDDYLVSTGIATLSSSWTGGSPSQGDDYKVFGQGYATFFFDEFQKQYAFTYFPRTPGINEDISVNSYADVIMNNLVAIGEVSINNNSASSINTMGGAVIQGRLLAGTNVGIGDTSLVPTKPLHIRSEESTLLIESTSIHSAVEFKKQTNTSSKVIVYDGDTDSLAVKSIGSGETYDTADTSIHVNGGGQVGIMTDAVGSNLTIVKDSFISMSDDNGYIGIVGGFTDDTDTTAANIMLFGEGHNTRPGDVVIKCASTFGSLSVVCGDSSSFEIDSLGRTRILNTSVSSSMTEGSVMVHGGASISCTEDAISIFSGGAFTVGGGASIEKSAFVGGNLSVNGSLNVQGVGARTLTTFDPVNCTVLSVENVKVIPISNELLLSFVIRLAPTISSESTSINFALPERHVNLEERHDLVATCSGWTDDTNLVVLQNILATGVVGTTRGILKFQSVNTTIHNVQVIARYSQQ